MQRISDLNRFFVEYNEWAMQPDPQDSIKFRTSRGLCGNLVTWAIANDLPHIYELTHKFRKLRIDIFKEDFVFPFNTAGSFSLERNNNTCHRNAARLQFVHDMIIAYNKGGYS